LNFIDLAKKLQPKVVIAENVKGLLMGEAVNYVRKINEEFEKAGYYIQHHLLDASKMGVPQKRERVFFIAIRKDLATQFLYQKTMFDQEAELRLEFDEKEIPFKDIESPGDRKKISSSIMEAYKFCMNKKTADFAKYFETVLGKRKYFNTRLIFKNAVCGTIKGDCTHVIEGAAAYINETELKLAGSYPLDYDFRSSTESYLIGMSVPPLMTAKIAEQIKIQWLDKLKESI